MPNGSFPQEQGAAVEFPESLDVAIDSPAIRRLVEEVRVGEFDMSRSYDRTYNRHNR